MRQHVHAPGSRLRNWYTDQFCIVGYKPLCGRLPAGDTVGDPGDKVTCPACQQALQQAREEVL